MDSTLTGIHEELIVLRTFKTVEKTGLLEKIASGEFSPLLELFGFLLKGEFPRVINHDIYKQFWTDFNLDNFEIKFHSNSDISDSLGLFLAVALGQAFVQLNYTGPSISETIQVPEPSEYQELLSVDGLTAYELASKTNFLVVSLAIFEKLSPEYPLLGRKVPLAAVDIEPIELKSDLQGYINWWRCRFLQVQMSLFSDVSGVLVTVLSALLLSAKAVVSDSLQVNYFLEKARNSYQGELENQVVKYLDLAKKLTGFEMIITGAKAKKTRYQNVATAGLVVLAKSKVEDPQDEESEAVENKQLNSDLLLEIPKYEMSEKLDDSDQVVEQRTYSVKDRLIPVAMRSSDIPEALLVLDINNQPRLSSLDAIQLYLRLITVRQISPSGSALVEEELMALVQRLIANGLNNWLLFLKCLWQRSEIESNKAKTVERGVFQMQALVEELNTEIARIFPEKKDANTSGRLRYFHLLPLQPRWSLDVVLAEKYVSIGVMKSALEIYERLGMVAETAACYGSFGQEEKAKDVLQQHLAKHPEDARCWSILGDVTSDPELWEKAWRLGKYQNAKVSLSRYYYSKGQLDLLVKHMNEVLKQNPLNFSNWYFYGCLGLETEQYESATEAFTRCVSIDDTHPHAWSNLGSSLLHVGKSKEALSAFENAVKLADASNWKIWENYQLTALRLGEWNKVLHASKVLVQEHSRPLNIEVVSQLVLKLVETPYQIDSSSFFDKTCIDYVCNVIPKINTNSKIWKLQAKVELWRNKPAAALDCYEKAFRGDCNLSDLISNETVWNKAVESCGDLVSAYENLGEKEGENGELVCKDWKFKSKSAIRVVMNRGRISWKDSEGWEKLELLKEELV